MNHRAYPLTWPAGWPRTTAVQRRASPYKCSLDQAVKDLLAELRRMKAKDITISSNVRTGLGVKMSESEVKDPGVAVYWTHRDGQPRVMACDHWYRLRDNIRAIGLAVQALRQLERCGASAILDRALSSFAALPAAPTWRDLLGFQGENPTKAEIRDRFRELAATHHPDRGGDATHFGQISVAYHEAMGQAVR